MVGSLSKTGCSRGITKTDLDAAYKQGFKDAVEALRGEPHTKVKGIWKRSRLDDSAVCSICLYEHYLGSYHQYATNFCPQCGAEMEAKD